MKKALTLCVLLLTATVALTAQDFNRYFTDRTLRLDYSFAGNAEKQTISLDELATMPRWYGKRQRLAELPLEGNGQITVRDHRTHEPIYRNSFSTLFQEWLTYDEAKTTSRTFENVFLVPMPKDTVDVTVDLRDNRRQVTTTFTHTVAPTDILIKHIGEHHVTPYITLNQADDTTRCIHIAYVAEGYTREEMPLFEKDARRAMDALFAHEPFKSLRGRFNVVAVESPSAESGTSTPHNGVWKNTALHSHFDTFYSDRYLTTLHLKDLHDWLAGTPYEHINSYNLAAMHHAQSLPVVVHEFGHSFGGLADEYAYDFEQIPMYPHDVEPWEPNITTRKDFKSKWEDMTGKQGVGLYEGAGYSLKGVYRPCHDCRMRTNENPDFCPVCRRALTRLIDFYTR